MPFYIRISKQFRFNQKPFHVILDLLNKSGLKTCFFALLTPFKHTRMMTKVLVLDNEKRLERTAYILKAIAHPLRIRIIQQLYENKELTVSTIYKNLNAEQSLISHHLINMRDKGVLEIRRSGKNIFYFLVDESIAEIIDCIYRSKLIA